MMHSGGKTISYQCRQTGCVNAIAQTTSHHQKKDSLPARPEEHSLPLSRSTRFGELCISRGFYTPTYRIAVLHRAAFVATGHILCPEKNPNVAGFSTIAPIRL